MENQAVAPSPTNSAPVKAAVVCLILAWIFALLPIPFISMMGMIAMNIVAFILAVICLTKSAVKPGVGVLVGSLVVTPLMYFLGLAVLGAGLGGVVEGYNHRAAQVAQSKKSVLEGKWTGQFTYEKGAKADFKMTVTSVDTADKDAFSGKMSETDPRSKRLVHSTFSGSQLGNNVIFTQKYSGQPDVTCSGTLNGDRIETGTCVVGAQSAAFVASKEY